MRAAPAIALFIVPAAVAAGQTYTVVDIGSLPDATPETVPTPPNSLGWAINEAGVVTGSSAVAGGSMYINEYTLIAEPWIPHAILWSDGVLTDLGVLGPDVPPDVFPRPQDTGRAVNILGQVVGEAALISDGLYHAFISLPEPAYGLPAGVTEIPAVDESARAWGINDVGIVVGESQVGGIPHAVRWMPGGGQWAVTDLGALAGYSSIAYGVNESGQVTGTFTVEAPETNFHAFLWLPEPAYGLPAGMNNLTAATGASIGFAINDLGQVAGRGYGWQPLIWLPEPAYGLPAGVTVFQTGDMFEQDFLDEHDFLGVVRAEFLAINNEGVAVGNVEFGVLTPIGGFAVVGRGFVWSDGVFRLSEQLLPPGSDWVTLHFAGGVNDAGQIIGEGVFPNDDVKGYVLTPGVPGDLDGDGIVGVQDFLMLLADWGPCPAPPALCTADLDGDGQVGVADFLMLLADWTF